MAKKKTKLMKKELLILIVEDTNDVRFEAIFYDAQKAADYCEKECCFGNSYKNVEGKLKPIKAFYEARAALKPPYTVTVRKTDRYKYGSNNSPCHDVLFFCGDIVNMEVDHNIAWGATRKEAKERCEKHLLEALKRVAGAKAAEKKKKELLAERKIEMVHPNFWNTIDKSVDPGKIMKKAFDKAYQSVESL